MMKENTFFYNKFKVQANIHNNIHYQTQLQKVQILHFYLVIILVKIYAIGLLHITMTIRYNKMKSQ